MVPLSIECTTSLRVVGEAQPLAHGQRSPLRSSMRIAFPVFSCPGGGLTIWNRPFAGATESGVLELLVEQLPEP